MTQRFYPHYSTNLRIKHLFGVSYSPFLYIFIREHLLKILMDFEVTHTELMEKLYSRVKDDFEGGVQWYGETVKLDLEARQMIERTKTKPEKYKLGSMNADIGPEI
jgi:hypothetical protein